MPRCTLAALPSSHAFLAVTLTAADAAKLVLRSHRVTPTHHAAFARSDVPEFSRTRAAVLANHLVPTLALSVRITRQQILLRVNAGRPYCSIDKTVAGCKREIDQRMLEIHNSKRSKFCLGQFLLYPHCI